MKNNVVARDFRPVNLSGIEPTEYKVVVKPEEVQQKIGSIFIPEDHQEKQQFSQQEGILIAISPAAFNYDGMVQETAPKPGDRVLYAKFAGFMRKGKDGVEYRIIADKDIVAVLT